LFSRQKACRARRYDLATPRAAERDCDVAATATIYNPPSDGFPFMAAVFDPTGAVLACRAFPSRREAEAFLQAFIQDGAGEYGLSEHSPREGSLIGRG
jgi:hypothetical protein